MKIISLQAENVKNLKAVELKPDGTIVKISGKNGAGKSAVLDSLYMALAGDIVAEPIRKGQDRAEINVNLGEYLVRKVFTEAGARLEVRNSEGAKYPSPQALLDKIIGDLSFDPLEFKRMKPAEQRALLMKVAGLTFDDLNIKLTELREERTAVNRDVRNMEGTLSGLVEPNADTPDSKVSVSALLGEVRELHKEKECLLSTERHYTNLVQEVNRNKDRITLLQNEIAALDEDNARILRQIEAMAMAATGRTSASVGDKITAKQEEINNAESVNTAVDAANAYRNSKAELESAQGLSYDMTEQIKDLEGEKVMRAASAKFPLPGIGVNEEHVTFEDIPFSQISRGEQTRISTAMAMELNPTLRVIFIRDGSLLDSDNLAGIIKDAKDRNYQVWIENTTDTVGSGDVGIFIEDGSIVAVDGKAVQEATDNEKA